MRIAADAPGRYDTVMLHMQTKQGEHREEAVLGLLPIGVLLAAVGVCSVQATKPASDGAKLKHCGPLFGIRPAMVWTAGRDVCRDDSVRYGRTSDLQVL